MATRRRIRRLERRIARIKERLDVLDQVGSDQLHGPLKALAEEIEKRTDIDLDRDDDGNVEFEEFVDAVVEFADEKIKGGPLLELATDVGLEILAEVAVILYRRTEGRLRRRLARLERRLERLQKA